MKLPVLLLTAALLTACAGTPNGVIAQNELVTLELQRAADTTVLRLIPAEGAQINAQFKPMLQSESAPPLVFDSPAVTADSEYFTAPPVATLGNTNAISGKLLASVCPKGKRVCLSVSLPVVVR